MRRALVKYNNILTGIISEEENGEYKYVYNQSYIEKYPHLFITFNIPVSLRFIKAKDCFLFLTD